MKEEILSKLLNYMDTTEDFVLEQAPLLFQEITTYVFWSNLMWGLLALGGCILLLYIAFRVYQDKLLESDEKALKYFIILIFLAMCAWGFCDSAQKIIKAKLAPRYLIIQAIRGDSK